MPIIEIYKKNLVWSLNSKREDGVIADVPDVDGAYQMSTGDMVEIEMNPPESDLGVMAIALISDYFLSSSKNRGSKDLSSRRRVIHLGKKSRSGSVRLNFAENLVVILKD